MSNRWVAARPEYYVQTGGMHENPFGVPIDEIVRMVVENPPEVSAQVIFGKYVESSGLVFISEIIEKLFDRSLPRVMGNFWVDKQAAQEARALSRHFADYGSPFFTGVDFGRQTDFTVLTTLDTRSTPARVVYYKRLNRVPWESIYAEVGRARAVFGPNILCDSTGPGGDVVMDALENRVYCAKHHESLTVGHRCLRNGEPLDCDTASYLPLACCEGFYFTGTTKKELVEHLRNVLGFGYNPADPTREFGLVRCPPIPQTEEDLAFYTWADKGLSTDNLFSLALACWAGLEEVLEDPVYGSIFGD